MNFYAGESTWIFLASLSSSLASLTVISLYYLNYNDFSRKAAYVVINNLCLANFFYSLGTLPGTPQPGSSICIYQAIFTQWFSLSSYFWLTVMNYSMLEFLWKGNFKIRKRIYTICWGLPIILTALPLISMDYNSIDSDGDSWCWLKKRHGTSQAVALFWKWFTYYFFLLLCSFACLVFLIKASIESKNHFSHTRSIILDIIGNIKYYSVVIIVCTGARCVTYGMSDYGTRGKLEQSFKILSILSCMQGLLIALIFWLTMSEARRRLYYLCTGKRWNKPRNKSLYHMSADKPKRSSGSLLNGVPKRSSGSLISGPVRVHSLNRTSLDQENGTSYYSRNPLFSIRKMLMNPSAVVQPEIDVEIPDWYIPLGTVELAKRDPIEKVSVIL